MMQQEIPRLALTSEYSGLKKAHTDDAGFDISAQSAYDLRSVHPSQIFFIDTGIYLEIPNGMAGLLLPRSGLARKKGLWIPNSPGLIDPGYRGMVKVQVARIDPTPPGTSPVIEPGDRIAQLVFINIWNGDPELIEREDLIMTDRGEGGFGSTGE